MERKHSRLIRFLLGGIGALLVLEAFLLVLVFVSPSSGTGIRRGAARAANVWSGSKEQPGIQGRIVRAAKHVNRSWLQPLWTDSQPPRRESPFAGCASCHRDYAEQRRYGTVYMNHSLHAQTGVACEKCHTDIAHPNPPPPPEEVCAQCHGEVQARGKCSLCHPPGSLPHFYVLGAPRGSVECRACHPRGALPTGTGRKLIKPVRANGSDRSLCMSCHQQTKCDSCHTPKHPAGWVKSHGGIALGGDAFCYSCHDNTWCAERCHLVGPYQPLRLRPLPTESAFP